MTTRTFELIIATLIVVASALVALAILMVFSGEAEATPLPIITVDGNEYDAGPPYTSAIDHYYTPETNPTAAFTARHVWNGVNGADLLPCEGGIHWIDNENLLTISHCLEVTPDTTTTTEPSTTTTSVGETTTSTSTPTVNTTTTTTDPATTTSSSTTTSTTDPTTTTSSSTTTTTTPVTTTVPPTTTTTLPTLPKTGPNVPLTYLGLLSFGAIVLGSATVIGSRLSTSRS